MSNFTQRMSVLVLSFSGFLDWVLRLTTKARLLQVGLSFPPLDPSLPGVDSVLTLQFGDFSQRSQGLVGWALLRRHFSCFRHPLTTLGKRGRREEAVSWTLDIPTIQKTKVFFPSLFRPSYLLFSGFPGSLTSSCHSRRGARGALGVLSEPGHPLQSFWQWHH